MSLDQLSAYTGLFLGLSGGAFGLWWGRKKVAEKRGLDERYQTITTKSLAASWKITLAFIYLLFILLISGVELSRGALLGGILIVHMAGWTFSTIYYNYKF
jgi:hypothetical protein